LLLVLLVLSMLLLLLVVLLMRLVSLLTSSFHGLASQVGAMRRYVESAGTHQGGNSVPAIAASLDGLSAYVDALLSRLLESLHEALQWTDSVRIEEALEEAEGCEQEPGVAAAVAAAEKRLELVLDMETEKFKAHERLVSFKNALPLLRVTPTATDRLTRVTF